MAIIMSRHNQLLVIVIFNYDSLTFLIIVSVRSGSFTADICGEGHSYIAVQLAESCLQDMSHAYDYQCGQVIDRVYE
jgi:hypothetical protein